jgi:acetyl-CoA carboxylase carboxyl transferase subunit alpha
MAYDLEFEKPLAELEKKITALQKKGDRLRVDELQQLKDLEYELQSQTEVLYQHLTTWQIVQVARHKERPQALEYVKLLFDDFFELRGDRGFSDDHAILGGLARLDGETVMLVSHQKGRTMKEKQHYNNGMPHPEGFRKAARLMQQAEKFGIPVVSLVDTQGAFPGLEDEERGQHEAIASSLLLMARMRTPSVAVVIGEGGSGGALAICVTDRILMLENSILTVTSPESAASILWKTTAFAQEAANAMRFGGHELKKLGLVDEVIPEPLGGAHRDPEQTAASVKEALVKHLTEVKQLPVDELLEQRYQKYRQIGEFGWAE